MRSTILLLALAMLAGCERDPLRLQVIGDGGPRIDTNEPQTDGPKAERPLTDGSLDGRRLDTKLSYDACRVQLESCNNLDDNCDGAVDETFDKLKDWRYCEECKGCSWLLSLHAVAGCNQGKCAVASCASGFWDVDKDPKNGCEHACLPNGVEVCDGEDNDCNGKVDDGVSLPAGVTFCKTQGACAGAQATCQGAKGWLCSYDVAKGAELQPCKLDTDCGVDAAGQPIAKCDAAAGVCPGLLVTNEKKCDGLDGDCDGLADDPWKNVTMPNALDKECDFDPTPKLGLCRNLGKYVCDPATKDKTICQLTKPGQAPAPETCNGVDDNCDGKVDNLDPASASAELWVSMPGGLKIFMHEASRPDSTATAGGIISDGRPCSVPGRLPWANITRTEAQAACVRAGARLCTTAEWEQACKGSAATLFPYGNTFEPQTCNGRAYDPATDAVLATDKPGGKCVSTWAGNALIYNMSGNLKEWTAIAFSGATPTGYQIKGGAYDTPSLPGFGAGLSCEYDLPAPPSNLQLPTLGFRCCK